MHLGTTPDSNPDFNADRDPNPDPNPNPDSNPDPVPDPNYDSNPDPDPDPDSAQVSDYIKELQIKNASHGPRPVKEETALSAKGKKETGKGTRATP